MVAVVEADTAEVEMLKVAVLAPAFTVTDEGTVTPEVFEVSDTTSPPVGALPEMVTVPVAVFPP